MPYSVFLRVCPASTAPFPRQKAVGSSEEERFAIHPATELPPLLVWATRYFDETIGFPLKNDANFLKKRPFCPWLRRFTPQTLDLPNKG